MKYTNQFLYPKEVRESYGAPEPTAGALFMDGIEIDGYDVVDKWVPSFSRAGYGLSFERGVGHRVSVITIIYWTGKHDGVDIIVDYNARGTIAELEEHGYGGGHEYFDSLGDAVIAAENWLEEKRPRPGRKRLCTHCAKAGYDVEPTGLFKGRIYNEASQRTLPIRAWLCDMHADECESGRFTKNYA